jgi:hypothetical protein
MTPNADAPAAAPKSPWTIARIQGALTSPVLIRRFLFDLAHAPETELMNVFAAWRQVAATIEVHASRPSVPEASAGPGHRPVASWGPATTPGSQDVPPA